MSRVKWQFLLIAGNLHNEREKPTESKKKNANKIEVPLTKPLQKQPPRCAQMPPIIHLPALLRLSVG